MKLIRDRFDSLTPRQKEVVQLLAGGLKNAEIADCLGMTVHTVKAHRAEIMRRMEAYTFAELMRQILSLQLTQTANDVAHKSIHIVVVEDDPWHRDYLTDNLNEHGFVAVGVADGDEFRKTWTESPADIVILDIELGINKEDGITIAARILENSACGVIMVTAHGEPEERIKGLSVGADAYFSKPVNIDELVLTINNLWRRFHPSDGV